MQLLVQCMTLPLALARTCAGEVEPLAEHANGSKDANIVVDDNMLLEDPVVVPFPRELYYIYHE